MKCLILFSGKYKTICMKCQILFSEKYKKSISNCDLLKILPRVLKLSYGHAAGAISVPTHCALGTAYQR